MSVVSIRTARVLILVVVSVALFTYINIQPELANEDNVLEQYSADTRQVTPRAMPWIPKTMVAHHLAGDFVNTSPERLAFYKWRTLFRSTHAYYCGGDTHCDVSTYKCACFGGILRSMGYELTNDTSSPHIAFLPLYGKDPTNCEQAFPSFADGKQIRWCLGSSFYSYFHHKDGLVYALLLFEKSRNSSANENFALWRSLGETPDDVDKFPCLKAREFIPKTFAIRSEQQLQTVVTQLEATPKKNDSSDKWYILKSVHGDRAEGTRVIQDIWSELDGLRSMGLGVNGTKARGYVLQEYLRDPLLWNRRKFEMRTWAFVLSVQPLIVLYHDGLIKKCLHDYDRNKYDPFAHISNLQTTHPQIWAYVRREGADVVAGFFDELEGDLNRRNVSGAPDPVSRILRPRMQKIMTYAIYAIRNARQYDHLKMTRPSQRFKEADVFGDSVDPISFSNVDWSKVDLHTSAMQHICFDFYISDNLDVYLTEVNQHGLIMPMGDYYLPPQQREIVRALGYTSIKLSEEYYYRKTRKLSLSPTKYYSSLGTWDILIDEAARDQEHPNLCSL